MSGRYASYWHAFLLSYLSLQFISKNEWFTTFRSAVTCYLENILYFYLPCTLRPLNCDTVDMRKVFDVYHVDQLHVLQNDILRLPVFKRFVVNTSIVLVEPRSTVIIM